MATIQSTSIMPSSKHNMGLKKSSPSHQGLTPPDSPAKAAATSQAIVRDLKHLFGIFLEKVLDPTSQEPPNTPVCHDQSLPELDKVRQALDYVSAELSVASKPAQSSSAGEELENVPDQDGFDLKRPICTTSEDFQSFEKWLPPQFKSVKETYVLS